MSPVVVPLRTPTCPMCADKRAVHLTAVNPGWPPAQVPCPQCVHPGPVTAVAWAWSQSSSTTGEAA